MASQWTLTLGLLLGLTIGCVTDGSDPDCTPLPGDPCGAGGHGYSAPTVIGGLAFSDGFGSGSQIHPIAAGGADRLTVSQGSATALTASMIGPFNLTAVDRVNPYPGRQDYLVRSEAAGDGTLVLSSSNFEDHQTNVSAQEIADLRLLPVDTTYDLATPGAFAVLSSAAHVVLGLWGGGTHTRSPLDDIRLIDATVLLEDAGNITQAAWDLFDVPSATPGSYELRLSADSFGEVQLSLPVVDSIDRIDAVDTLNDRPGKAEVCFHARKDDVEVVIPFDSIDVTGTVEELAASRTNCLFFKYAPVGERVTVTARALGVETTHVVVP